MLHALPPENAATRLGNSFFPGLMAGPFKHGLLFAFTFSAALYLVAALASWLSGSERHQETADLAEAGLLSYS